MTQQSDHHALVVGASGLIGWAVMDQLLCPYPSPSPFRQITALFNRPLKLKDSFWVSPSPGGPRIDLVSGADLTCSHEHFVGFLRQHILDVTSISHVFYFAFKEHPIPEQEVAMNVGMMKRVICAVKCLSSGFKFFVYPGGTRGYGIYRSDGMFTTPLVEEMADQLPDDYARTVSYPHYRALLRQESRNQDWTWSELCPDIIVGFTPNGSGYSLAGHWATYLCVYKLVHGKGAEVPFPGVQAAYDARYTETSATTLARVAIHASLHPEQFRERIFNVADSARPSTMRDRWPQLAAWFGLKGVPPSEVTGVGDPKPSQFIKEHQGTLEEAGAKGIDIWNAAQLDSVGYWLTFDRQLSLDRLRTAGFVNETAPEKGWWEAFEMFKRAGMIC